MASQDLDGSVNAAELSWPGLQESLTQGRPLILTIGSFEQHGPHLPLNTDTLIVGELARRVAERVDGLVLPTLPFGAPSRPRSGGGDRFPVPDLPLTTLIPAVEALAEGSLAAGCQWLIVLSWHLENAAVLWEGLRGPAHRHAGTVQLFESPWDYLGEEIEDELFPEGDPDWDADHAGRLETAMMLHLAPHLVGDPPAPVQFVPRHGYDVLPTPPDAVPATGAVLDSRMVTRETGERSTNAIVDGIASAIASERERH
jgi:creatinine amidohydrolase